MFHSFSESLSLRHWHLVIFCYCSPSPRPSLWCRRCESIIPVGHVGASLPQSTYPLPPLKTSGLCSCVCVWRIDRSVNPQSGQLYDAILCQNSRTNQCARGEQSIAPRCVRSLLSMCPPRHQNPFLSLTRDNTCCWPCIRCFALCHTHSPCLCASLSCPHPKCTEQYHLPRNIPIVYIDHHLCIITALHHLYLLLFFTFFSLMNYYLLLSIVFFVYLFVFDYACDIY